MPDIEPLIFMLLDQTSISTERCDQTDGYRAHRSAPAGYGGRFPDHCCQVSRIGTLCHSAAPLLHALPLAAGCPVDGASLLQRFFLPSRT